MEPLYGAIGTKIETLIDALAVTLS